MKKILLATCLVAALSCKKDNAPQQKPAHLNAKESFNKGNPAPGIDSFAFPEDIRGCSCYFAKDKSGFEAQRYIYADDFGKRAFMKINGRMLQFPINDDEFNDQKFIRRFKDRNLSIEIIAEKIDGGEETTMFRGRMTVTASDGQSSSVSLYGECGC